MPPREHKNLFYYLTLFKIEGHETWRAHLSGDADGFTREWSQGKHPVVTKKMVKKIDRVSGEILFHE